MRYLKNIILGVLLLGVLMNSYFWWEYKKDQEIEKTFNQAQMQNLLVEEHQKQKKNNCVDIGFKQYYTAWVNVCIDIGETPESCRGKDLTLEEGCSCMLSEKESMTLNKKREQWEKECVSDV